MNINEIKSQLCKNILYKEQIDSTISWAKRYSLEHPDEKNTVFVSDMQTAGIGRNGHTWICKFGQQINMSILLYPNIDLSKLQLLCICTALAVNSAIIKLTGLPCNVKWPNDVLINNRKLCGILCENIFLKKDNPAVIIGIGVNVNNDNFSGILDNKATSIFIESKKIMLRVDIINAILDEFNIYYDKLISGKIDDIISKYKTVCISLNKIIDLNIDYDIIHALVIDINNLGELVVQLDSGEIKTINHGEIIHQNIYSN